MTRDLALPKISLPLTSDDLNRICYPRKPYDAERVIAAAIAELSGIRIYVCEPGSDSDLQGLWQIAYDLAVTALIDAGYTVIDAHQLYAILKLDRITHKVVGSNPMLRRLIDQDLVDVVCIPGNLTEDQYEHIKREIRIGRSVTETMTYALLIDP